MQPTLPAFTRARQRTETLPINDTTEPKEGVLKRRREEQYATAYPFRPRADKALASQLYHLRERLCGGPFAYSRNGRRQHSRGTFLRDQSPSIRTVVSSIHPNRITDDGELLLSPLDTFRNCILSSIWDHRDEFLIVVQRAGFQLFEVSSWIGPGKVLSQASRPVLELKSTTVQERLGGEHRNSFGILFAQFLGSTLNTICGYSSVPHLDVFDLEDLDEAAGEPLRSYNLRSLKFDSRSQLASGVSSATAVVTVSDAVAVAALSNGCSALVDVRATSPLICTEAPPPPAILSACNSGTRRLAQGTAITAVEVADRSNGIQLLTGTKDGMLVLWDLRKRNEPVAISSVGGAIQALHIMDPSSSYRCGAPEVWLNTDSGGIGCFSIGASSFEQVARISTGDSRRTPLSANLLPPKISVAPNLNCLIYPHVFTNTLLFYDISGRVSLAESHANPGVEKCGCAGTRENARSAYQGNFSDARSLLLEWEKDEDSLLSPSDLKRSALPLPLFFSCPFSGCSYQICSVSASNRNSAICIGGDDGDLHVLFDFPS
ncbi:hypothetical protein JIQ42_00584 [Leishmania sp. Namibia]|uniref:hypothetical protein n=1 Tax=Leishmania sp. Namibia TaxID=2802991 RepID=UPI001B58CE9A|nr:hypothetical protein JIQ42_00584 [Leishmania sp. Namibia]